ncbi:MAG: T9SS type A sorting domain-containing protein [Flavobacteriales bacterium]|jgi:hypothetical protein|nr:T9SS type A sorting domain-containing protein [Flavobacteriales bacterium]
MKKVLLIAIAAILYYGSYGQILSASTSADFQSWSIADLNNDGFNFQEVNWGNANPPTALSPLGEAIFSESYDSGNGVGITPDNLFISPVLNLSSVTSSDISWKVAATDPNYPAEKYSVYLSTSPTNLANATLIFSETMATGGQVFTRSVSSAAYAGQNNIYLIFRHHDCFDQFKLTIDDILLESGSGGCNFSATISKTDVSAQGANDGSATVSTFGGTAPYSYSWTPSGGNGSTASNLSPGTYTCTVTDADNCTATATVTINDGPSCQLVASAAVTNVSNTGMNNGSINITVNNGTPPYSYDWHPNISASSSASNLSPGSYVIEITDADGCSVTLTEYVEDFVCTLSASTTSSDVTTVGGNDGTASVTAVGGTAPYSYFWSPGGSTSIFQNALSKGTYTVQVTDANNCSVSVTIIINDPGCNLSVSTTSTNESYYGANDGSAQVTASGGTTPYSYIWSPSGGNSAMATGLAPDVYTAIVVDDAGCSATSIVTIEAGNFVSVDEVKENDLDLNVYPNPTSNQLNIQANQLIKSVAIVNLSGQVLYSKNAMSESFSIDVNHLSSGIYFYQLETKDGEMITNRFVKK